MKINKQIIVISVLITIIFTQISSGPYYLTLNYEILKDCPNKTCFQILWNNDSLDILHQKINISEGLKYELKVKQGKNKLIFKATQINMDYRVVINNISIFGKDKYIIPVKNRQLTIDNSVFQKNQNDFNNWNVIKKIQNYNVPSPNTQLQGINTDLYNKTVYFEQQFNFDGDLSSIDKNQISITFDYALSESASPQLTSLLVFWNDQIVRIIRMSDCRIKTVLVNVFPKSGNNTIRFIMIGANQQQKTFIDNVAISSSCGFVKLIQNGQFQDSEIPSSTYSARTKSWIGKLQIVRLQNFDQKWKNNNVGVLLPNHRSDLIQIVTFDEYLRYI